MKRFNLILLLASLFLGGCSGTFPGIPTPTMTPPQNDENLRWSTIATYDFIRANNKSLESEDVPREAVLVKAQDINNYSDWVWPTDLDKIKSVDFSKSIVVVVFMGYRGTDKYSVEIKDVRKSEQTVTISTVFITPTEGQLSHPIVTSPYYILEIDKMGDFIGTFTFVLKNQEAIVDQVKVDITN
jgi:hypothetical protein